MSIYLSASLVCPVSSPPLENGVISVDDAGRIIELIPADLAKERNLGNVRFLEGVLVPGLINTHVHLELSHLKGKIEQGTGLPGFVRQIMQQRAAAGDEILEAMKLADDEQYRNGIVAAGDISNQLISKSVKMNSAVYYQTFVETMGFNPVMAEEIIVRAKKLKQDFLPLTAAIAPHAPYSVSKPLFELIRAEDNTACITIHNQETAEENQFFERKEGHFLDLYKFLGLDISFFQTQQLTSLQYFLPLMPDNTRILLVHNTFTSAQDVKFALESGKDIYWCLCPNANLYIEKRLPDLKLFRQEGLNVTLGTDSLGSNHQLSILEEMKTLHFQADIPFHELIRWATLNGARFLGLDRELGSFEKGKKPGINLITGMKEGTLTPDTTIQRIL